MRGAIGLLLGGVLYLGLAALLFWDATALPRLGSWWWWLALVLLLIIAIAGVSMGAMAIYAHRRLPLPERHGIEVEE